MGIVRDEIFMFFSPLGIISNLLSKYGKHEGFPSTPWRPVSIG